MLKLRKFLKLIIISICVIFLIVAISAYSDIPFFNKKNNSTDTTQVKSDSENNDTNILLLGDTSDAMMVATIDTKNKDVKINPVDSDSYANITDKEDLLSTIEKDTNISLDKFVQIDFQDLMNIVSVIGEVPVNVKSDEVDLMNNLIPKYFAESNYSSTKEMELIKSAGEQKLNAYQTLAYASIIADDANKQKEVLISVVDKVKNIDLSMYPELYKTIKPYISTNMTFTDILSLASSSIFK